MSTAGPAYGHGQREVSYGTVQQAEAAARDFQQRGYRRRTRSLAPGDVLVAEATEGGFSVFWIPSDVPPSPGGRECGWEKGPGDEGPPSPATRGRVGEGGRGVPA